MKLKKDEILRRTKLKSSKSQKTIINNNEKEKFFISLPSNVIKPRIRSTILEILFEKIEKKENSISLIEINENPKILDLLNVEPNANSFFGGCFEEIIIQGFLKKNDFLEDVYLIEEKMFHCFFEFMKKKLKG